MFDRASRTPRLKTVAILFLSGAIAIGAPSRSLSQTPKPAAGASDSARRVQPRGADPNFIVRIVPGIAMGLAGTFVGGLTGLIAPGCMCGNDFGIFPIAVLTGATLGTAIGAGAPKGRGLCSEGERFRRAFGGATLGLAAGVAFMRTEKIPGAWAATIPLGSVVFMRKC